MSIAKLLVSLVVFGALTVACSASKPAQAPATSRAPAPFGDLRPVVSLKELMRDMIDPASDYIFDSMILVITEKGTVDNIPTTDEDWEKLRFGAVTIAEGVSLLQIPRPIAPPGDENASSGPDGTELTPAQIAAKLEADPVEWNARIEALRNVGLEVLDIVRTKNTKELLDASENLDNACEACHRSYWYPREDQDFYRKLDRRLQELPASPAPQR